MIELSCIVLHYNTPSETNTLLPLLSGNIHTETIVVDNSYKTDGPFKLLKPLKNTHVYHMPENFGFAGGVNRGIEKSRGEWIAIINSDTNTTNKDIWNLINTAKTEKALVISPKLIYPTGKTQSTVGFFDTFWKHPINHVFMRPHTITKQLESCLLVDWATFGVMVIHRSVFKRVGTLDEARFFLYFEDIDFCFRLYTEHIPILYCPAVTITHISGASSQDTKIKQQYYKSGIQSLLLKHRGKTINALNNIIHFLR